MYSAIMDETDDIAANDRIRLDEDLPALSLRQGAEGVVRSTWSYPNRAYEVEFSLDRRRLTLLLLPGQLHHV